MIYTTLIKRHLNYNKTTTAMYNKNWNNKSCKKRKLEYSKTETSNPFTTRNRLYLNPRVPNLYEKIEDPYRNDDDQEYRSADGNHDDTLEHMEATLDEGF